MKTTFVKQILAAAAMICALMMMSSCEKELPVVIESEVYDEGEAGVVSMSPTDDGTALSYESWIMVRGVTKGSFDNRVSVILNGSMPNVEETHDVAIWETGEFSSSISREAEPEVRTEGFVTVTDSVLVYTVSCDEFEFSYRLCYEVGVYDDGVTRQIMPYHYFSNIRDNGGVLEDADSYVDGDYAYARKIYRHSITVDFGGESYDVEAAITLRRALGPASEPYILRSEIVDKSIEPLPSEDGFLSSVTVKSAMSTGEEATETYSVELPVFAESSTGEAVTIYGSIDDIELMGAEMVETSRSYDDGGEYIVLERISEDCVLHYNGFDVVIPFVRYAAEFDNIVLQDNMNGYEFDEESIRVTNADWTLVQEKEEGAYYMLSLTVEVEIAGLVVEGVYDGGFAFMK